MSIFQDRFTKISINIILVLLIFYLICRINFLLGFIKVASTIIIIPLFIGGFLYYLMRPLTRFLTQKLHNRYVAVILTFILIIGLTVFISYFGGTIISTQLQEFIKIISNFYSSLQEGDQSLFDFEKILPFLGQFNLQERIISFMQKLISIVNNNIGVLLSKITNIGTALILIPFVLFYLLLDDRQLAAGLIEVMSEERREKWLPVLKEIDETLASYLNGQLLVAFVLGILTYIGYLIIGLPSALILAIIAMVTSLIPFIGPILGAVPAVLIGLTSNIYLILKILLVIFIVQQLEGNVVRPNIHGERLKIHPLIVIFVIFIAMILFGFVGALFAVPVYAVIRILLKNFYFQQQARQ